MSTPERDLIVGGQAVIEGVMMRRESHVFEEQRLVLNRKGAPEECFLRLTYSPVPGALPAHRAVTRVGANVGD